MLTMIIKNPNSSGKRSICTCKFCGQEFSALDIKIRAGKEKFCSRECYDNYRRLHKKDPKERNVIHQKKYKYGITEDEYLNMFSVQDNKCAICGKSFEETKAFVDHDHKTGKVRGLLCTKCNSVLGMADDNTEILNKAIKYLSEQ